MFRLAHISDIHFTLPPLSLLGPSLRGKRAAGILSYYIGGRRRRFGDIAARIAQLLDDVDAQQVDHMVLTGDLTAVSLPEEFSGLAALFGARREHPERYTVIPGNHDRYTPRALAERSFEREFASLCPGVTDGFPFTKQLGERVRLIGMDPCHPTAPWSAAGWLGEEQLKAVDAQLAAPFSGFTIAALHYGLLRYDGRPDNVQHGLRDAARAAEIFAARGVGLVVHGHIHRAFTVSTGQTPIVCAGSSTDLHTRCGYNIYAIDPEAHALRIQRRCYDPASRAYVDVEMGHVNAALQERRGALI